MTSDRDKVRLIFGLKVKQLRNDLGISTYELANRTGLSPSYLNEIEKGKKYPKTEKLLAIAKALQTDYDSLVSLKVSKQLEPVVELLNSNILSELPFELFGIEPNYFLEVMATAPAKLSAFISTILEIGRNYDVRVEQFYFTVLRTYQAMHDNYFEDLEAAADRFLQDYPCPSNPAEHAGWLAGILEKTYKTAIETYTAQTQSNLLSLRSVYLPEKHKLLINKSLTDEQTVFTLAREVGYRRLNLTIRPLESSVLEGKSFDEVLNNFRATYFARAILIPEKAMTDVISGIVTQKTWENKRLLAAMQPYGVTPEMFLLRMTSILTSRFGINELFFLRINQRADQKRSDGWRYIITKELHLNKLHTPHGTIKDEHYCRRQNTVTVLTELRKLQESGQWDGEPICRAQRITFATTGTSYFVFSVAKPSPPSSDNSSINIGFPLTDRLREVFTFLSDPAIPETLVGETCERCPIRDCAVRAAEPVVLTRDQEVRNVQDTIERLRK